MKTLKEKARNELHYGLKQKNLIYDEKDIKEAIEKLLKRHKEIAFGKENKGGGNHDLFITFHKDIKEIFGDFSEK